jgi:iron complex transport system ATP-binding protein
VSRDETAASGAANGSSSPLLAAAGVHVALGRSEVLRGVDLTADRGELVAVVGPNGAGKSTLIAALAGDISPQRGRVLLGGDDVARMPLVGRARRRAVLPQRVDVALPFTVEDIVTMGRSPWHAGARSGSGTGSGTSPEDDRAVIDAAIAATELGPLRSRRVTDLSGGELARVALARVLAQGCDVLLLDEPTAALDVRHQELALGLLRSEADSGRAVVVAIHDLDAAVAYADRLVVLDRGRVVADDAPREVLASVDLGAVFGVPIVTLEDGDGRAIVRPVRPARPARAARPSRGPVTDVED